MKIHRVEWEEIYEKIETIKRSLVKKDSKIYGIGIGGQIIAGLTDFSVDNIEDADIIVDVVYDSGPAHQILLDKYPEKEFVFLYNKQFEHQDEEIEFPWSKNYENKI